MIDTDTNPPLPLTAREAARTPRAVGAAEAARLCGVSKATWHRRAAAGCAHAFQERTD